MEITWFGHSCFLIKDKDGRKLLTDPFDNTIGYNLPNESVDVVTVSHHHFDHDYTTELPGVPNVLDKCGYFNLCDIPISGIPSYHDTVKGAKRGENVIFVFEMDSLRLCHLGDLGHSLSADDIDKLGKIDILFIPVGGNYTINGKEASSIAKTINAHIVIPMHYKTPDLTFPLEGVEDFVTNMKDAERIQDYTLNVENVPESFNNVKILNYRK
jgi:L-ascorbate metabolism protein UlaG (beta-lactamase superfamily)